MKKMVLSVLAGVTVIGSAVALPSPEDRKALCEKHPEKYVWVEKTQACIPVHPCLSDDIVIRNAYCANVGSFVDENVMREVHNKYIEQILHTQPVSSSYYEIGKDRGGYYEYRLADGGYVSIYVLSGENPFGWESFYAVVNAACNAYNAYDEGPVLINEKDNNGLGCPLQSSGLCNELTRFVSTLNAGEFEGFWNENEKECVLSQRQI